jgi:hypothetical protein
MDTVLGIQYDGGGEFVVLHKIKHCLTRSVTMICCGSPVLSSLTVHYSLLF